MLRNNLETIIEGHISMQGHIKYFCHSLHGCIGCDLNNNSHGFSLSIHHIFYDGMSFKFFMFERMPNPTFLCGCFPGDSKHICHSLKVPDFATMATSLPFILQYI